MTGPARPRPTRGASSQELAGAPAPVLFPGADRLNEAACQAAATVEIFPYEGYRLQNLEAGG